MISSIIIIILSKDNALIENINYLCSLQLIPQKFSFHNFFFLSSSSNCCCCGCCKIFYRFSRVAIQYSDSKEFVVCLYHLFLCRILLGGKVLGLECGVNLLFYRAFPSTASAAMLPLMRASYSITS